MGARPFTPRAYTQADRDAFDARYAWPFAEQAQAELDQPEPEPDDLRELTAGDRWSCRATGFAAGMACLFALDALTGLLSWIGG